MDIGRLSTSGSYSVSRSQEGGWGGQARKRGEEEEKEGVKFDVGELGQGAVVSIVWTLDGSQLLAVTLSVGNRGEDMEGRRLQRAERMRN